MNENDNGEVDPTILWDALKAVIRGKLIAQTALIKKNKLELHHKLNRQLKELERQHQNMNDPETLEKVKEIRRQTDKILLTDVEKKARFVKAYYEGGPKASRLLARRIRTQ